MTLNTSELSHYELVVFRRLVTLTCKGAKPCTYSDDLGSREFRCSKSTIRRAVAGLLEKGWIVRTKPVSRKSVGLKGRGNIRCVWIIDCTGMQFKLWRQ